LLIYVVYEKMTLRISLHICKFRIYFSIWNST